MENDGLVVVVCDECVAEIFGIEAEAYEDQWPENFRWECVDDMGFIIGEWSTVLVRCARI